ncbi:putative transporter [Aphelenchoides besseyi]|nr:putative transporter [Aphelenchoides besseyi]
MAIRALNVSDRTPLLMETTEETTVVETPDDVLDKFKPWNPYILFVFICASSVWLFSGPNIMVSSFAVDEGAANTINAEFNLTGTRRYLADWTTSAYLLGNTVGAAVVARITDYKGRTNVVAISLFFMGVFGCVGALMNSIYLLMLMRFLQGFCFFGTGACAFNLAYESTPKSLRIYTTFFFGTQWVFGYCIVAPLALLFPYWRTLMIACSIPPAIAGIVLWFVLPESFHFMVQQGMEKELIVWLKKANMFNQQPVDVDIKSLIAAQQKKVKLEEKNILIQIIKNRRLLMYFLIMTVVWICDALIYYGISLYSTQLSGNKYINYVLLGLVEAPSNFFTPWFLKNLGRRLFISGTHFVAAISFLLLIFITNPTGALILWLIGKFGIICSFNCLYVYCSELFPTNIRNGCTGGCESVGRLFSTFAPALYSLKSIYVQLPTIVFTALAAISSGLVLCLPETKNANLPDTTADL